MICVLVRPRPSLRPPPSDLFLDTIDDQLVDAEWFQVNMNSRICKRSDDDVRCFSGVSRRDPRSLSLCRGDGVIGLITKGRMVGPGPLLIVEITKDP